MSREIKELLERHFKAWSAGDVEGIVACFSADAGMEDLGVEARFNGREGIRQMAARVLAAIPDLRWTPRRICVDGSTAVTEWHMGGTHQGDLPRIGPGTGNPFSVPGVSIDEVRDGLIQQHRDYWNVAAYRRQVGLAENYAT
jgi:steroid delta-isomerase-like uncharacterized protein